MLIIEYTFPLCANLIDKDGVLDDNDHHAPKELGRIHAKQVARSAHT
jgi:hypothetical protein